MSAHDIAKIAARLRGAKYRCEHAFGKNAAYRGVAFEFASAAAGAHLKVRGLDNVRTVFVFGIAAYNLVRLPKLLASTGEVCPMA